VDHHQLYLKGLVGTRGPQAPAIFRRNVFHTNAISENGRTPTGPSPIESLQIIARFPPLPPFALLRSVRRAANSEIQSVDEREKLPPSCQNRLPFQREIGLFSVLRKYCHQTDLSSKSDEETSFPCPTDAPSNSFSKKASNAPPQQLHPAAMRYLPTEHVTGGHADDLALRCSPERFGEATCTHKTWKPSRGASRRGNLQTLWLCRSQKYRRPRAALLGGAKHWGHMIRSDALRLKEPTIGGSTWTYRFCACRACG